MQRRLVSIVLVVVVSAVVLAAVVGCQPPWQLVDPTKTSLPAEVTRWLDSYKIIQVGTSMTSGDYTYFLASYGVKDSGVYKVEITGVELGGSEVVVKTKWTAAASFVAVVPQYPFALARARKTDKPVRFVTDDAAMWIPSLVGVPGAFRIQAASDSLLYSVPRTDSVELGNIMIGSHGWSTVPGEDEFVIEGIARVFEATVEYDLVDENNQPFGHGFVTAQAAGPEWGYFVIRLPKPWESAVQHIRVYSTSAEDGSIRDLVVIIP